MAYQGCCCDRSEGVEVGDMGKYCQLFLSSLIRLQLARKRKVTRQLL